MSINLVLCSIFLLLSTLGHTLGRRNLMMVPKGTMKTIKSLEDGEVIDCVDYYQQPAFQNPSINKSQVPHSYYPSRIENMKNSRLLGTQPWHKYGLCPEMTVPIRRGKTNRNFSKRRYSNGLDKREYAAAYQLGTFYGGAASINTWNPFTEDPSAYSSSKIWVSAAKETPDQNTLEAGLMVFPEKYKDPEVALTRLFVFLTKDNYRNSQCYDVECGNFVLVPGILALGCIYNTSVYDGHNVELEFSIFKDTKPGPNSGHWWVMIQDQRVGYWPHSEFTSLSNTASEIAWGGEILNIRAANRHTAVHMGSGHFPFEGLGKSSFIRAACVFDANQNCIHANFSGLRRTNKLCYDIKLQPRGSNYGAYFLYGGPGLSADCYA